MSGRKVNQITYTFAHACAILYVICEHIANLWHHVYGSDALVVREVIRLRHSLMSEDLKFIIACRRGRLEYVEIMRDICI